MEIMTNFKKIALLFSVCMIFSVINCSANQQNEFSDELYEYSKDINEKKAEQSVQDQKPTVVSDRTNEHYFDTGKTRTKVSKEVKDGMIITTTEKWVTKKSSYLTNMNIAAGLVVGAPLAIATTFYMYPEFYVNRLADILTGILSWDDEEYKEVNSFDILFQTDKVKKASFLNMYNPMHYQIDKYLKHNSFDIPIEDTDCLKEFKEFMDKPENAADAVKYLGNEAYEKDQFIINFNHVRSRKPEEFKSWLVNNAESCTKYMSPDYYQKLLKAADVK